MAARLGPPPPPRVSGSQSQTSRRDSCEIPLMGRSRAGDTNAWGPWSEGGHSWCPRVVTSGGAPRCTRLHTSGKHDCAGVMLHPLCGVNSEW